jgi:hypothetical protein
MILTAALELSRNQVTHFYSLKKNTDEMIKMADLLRQQYRGCRSIYLSWDAASWHVSRKLVEHLKTINRKAVRDGYPLVWTAPCLRVPNFSTLSSQSSVELSRAIIHNSDYGSLNAAKDAIDLHFRQRNEHFLTDPKRAGNNIWGKELVPSGFQEGQNCKDPACR